MSYPRLFGLLLLLGAVACTSHRITYDAESSVTYNEGVEKSLKVEAVWLKPRGEFVHVLLRYTNWYANPVTVDSEAVTMVVNDSPAHARALIAAVALANYQHPETHPTREMVDWTIRTMREMRGATVRGVQTYRGPEMPTPLEVLGIPSDRSLGVDPELIGLLDQTLG